MGDLKNGAMKAMATMGSVAKAGRAIGDNRKKQNDAKKRKAEIVASKNKLEQKQSILGAKMGMGSTGGTATTTSESKTSGGSTGVTKGDEEIKSILRNINSQIMQQQHDQNDKELRALDKELGQMEANISSAKLAKLTAPANVAAGLAFGLGANDLAAGAALTTALDGAAEKVGKRGADEARSRIYDETKEKGRENPEILRQKTSTSIKEEIKNTFTLKDLRDIGNILQGKDNNEKSNGQRNLSDYRYIQDKNNSGHKTISSSIDNI